MAILDKKILIFSQGTSETAFTLTSLVSKFSRMSDCSKVQNIKIKMPFKIYFYICVNMYVSIPVIAFGNVFGIW